MPEKITKGKLTNLLKYAKTIVDRTGKRNVTIDKWGYNVKGSYEGSYPYGRDPFRIDMNLSGITQEGLNMDIKYDSKLVLSVSEHKPKAGSDEMQRIAGVYIVEYLPGDWERKLAEIKNSSSQWANHEKELIEPREK